MGEERPFHIGELAERTGLSDAPALMQADVGIAIGAGTDIAIEASDVILIGERLSAVVDAYHIGHRSYRKTVQNLWLAFVFNGIGVPLAATGIVHPAWAMAAMAASVSTMLLNSFGGRLLPAPRREAEAGPAGAERPRRAESETPARKAVITEEAPLEGPEKLVLAVPDMHCSGCERNIETMVGGCEGVDAVRADANAGEVQVEFQPDRIGVPEIEEAVTSLGYRVWQSHIAGR